MGETSVRGINFFKTTDVASIKEALSIREMDDMQKQVEKVIKDLNGLGSILRGGTLLLRNGQLSTGHVSFAAFRTETLSLIFEAARKYLSKSSGEEWYRAFLSDLGHEVGFTYGREMIKNLRTFQCIPADDFALIELWALFENDTGAGTTTVSKINATTWEITLKNNPIGHYYDDAGAHDHCYFYNEYYRAILNEFLTFRPRLARDFMEHLKEPIWKVRNITERPRKNLCVFECVLKPESLSRAFDLLHISLIDMDDGKYGDAVASAREALIEAQRQKLFCEHKSAPKNCYKGFQRILSKQDFKLMDETYQRSCAIVHKSKPRDIKTSLEIVRHIRYCIHEIERLEISEEKIEQIRDELVAKGI